MYKFTLDDPHFLPHRGCRIDLSFRPGELIALVGENGIGKSTLVRRFCSDHPGLASLVEQGPLDFFYDRTLRKVKTTLIGARKEMISVENLNRCWKAFKLDEKEGRTISVLSGGEGQALKLCFGLCPLKEIYVLDEPSQFLDPEARKTLRTMIKEQLDQRKTVLVIEHDTRWLDLPMTVQELTTRENVLVMGKTWTT